MPAGDVLSAVLPAVGALLMVGGLLLVPLGLPGNWLMVGVVLVGAALGEVGVPLAVGLTAVAAGAEAGEFLLVKRFSERHGGSRAAFWGAVAGGLIGAAAGAPVPVAGSLVAAVLGTFLGAVAGALWETRELREAGRIGWGATLGRVAAAAVKTAAGFAILVAGGTALFL